MARPTPPPGTVRPLAVAAALLLLAGCSSTPGVPTPAAGGRSATTATTTTTDPGLLPQTMALPTSDAPQFELEMAALWRGVVDGSVSEAMAAFFPETAYRQVKAVADPDTDFRDRLVAEYGADVAAAHALVAETGGPASLVEVLVPARYAHWVPPGTCANRLGYYEVAGSRLVYRQGGTERSFGIASLISWRGVWYVVHLGAVVRSGSAGLVEDPEPGPGSSAPSTTC